MDLKQIELTEKDLHCLARIIQSEELAYDTKCLYCRYAFECKEYVMQNKKLPYMPVLKKIEHITGVNIFMNQETMQKEILAGSWIENCPELLKRFNGMSIHEQVVFLKSHDCLKYVQQGKEGRGKNADA